MLFDPGISAVVISLKVIKVKAALLDNSSLESPIERLLKQISSSPFRMASSLVVEKEYSAFLCRYSVNSSAN